MSIVLKCSGAEVAKAGAINFHGNQAQHLGLHQPRSDSPVCETQSPLLERDTLLMARIVCGSIYPDWSKNMTLDRSSAACLSSFNAAPPSSRLNLRTAVLAIGGHS